MTDQRPPFKLTKSGMWSDAEFFCQLAADGLGSTATWLRRLGGRCYRNGVAAKHAREQRQGAAS